MAHSSSTSEIRLQAHVCTNVMFDAKQHLYGDFSLWRHIFHCPNGVAGKMFMGTIFIRSNWSHFGAIVNSRSVVCVCWRYKNICSQCLHSFEWAAQMKQSDIMRSGNSFSSLNVLHGVGKPCNLARNWNCLCLNRRREGWTQKHTCITKSIVLFAAALFKFRKHLHSAKSESLPFDNWMMMTTTMMTMTTENIILMGILFGLYPNTIQYNHIKSAHKFHLGYFCVMYFFRF